MEFLMDLKTALKVVLEDESLGDFIYTVRSRAVETGDYKGNSWEHPRVQRFGQAVSTLQKCFNTLEKHPNLNDVVNDYLSECSSAVEHSAENRGVDGAIPSVPTIMEGSAGRLSCSKCGHVWGPYEDYCKCP